MILSFWYLTNILHDFICLKSKSTKTDLLLFLNTICCNEPTLSDWKHVWNPRVVVTIFIVNEDNAAWRPTLWLNTFTKFGWINLTFFYWSRFYLVSFSCLSNSGGKSEVIRRGSSGADAQASAQLPSQVGSWTAMWPWRDTTPKHTGT